MLRLPLPAIVFGVAAAFMLTFGALVSARGGAQEADDEGFEPLLRQEDGRYTSEGWKHHGPGGFDLDPETGEFQSRGGMGLHWFAERTFADFVLELEFKTSKPESNSGVFVRVPEAPTSDAYIYHSFEVQIHDTAERDVHRTGAVYDAEPARGGASRPTGEWNHMRITFVGDHISVELNGETVLDWDAEPRGKVEDFAASGYIGLQNHDRDSSVWFRNIRVKDLTTES